MTMMTDGELVTLYRAGESYDPIFEGRVEGLRAIAAAAQAETAATIVQRIRENCTPDSEAYRLGGDFLIRAVADWIENPPEWVDAPWRSAERLDSA